MSLQHLPSGYTQVTLKHNFQKFMPLVHALVAFAFLGPPPAEYGRAKIGINHKNANKSDNRPENLEWVTHQENFDHAMANRLMARGEANGNSILTVNAVERIRVRLAEGISERRIAAEFSCSRGAVRSIKYGLTWKHLLNP